MPERGQLASGRAGQFEHRPVMLEEVTETSSQLCLTAVVLDATVGAGGHARALLQAFPDLAWSARPGRRSRRGARLRLPHTAGGPGCVKGRFDNIEAKSSTTSASGELVWRPVRPGRQFACSSIRPERGFSYRFDAALDMRMDRSQSLTAARVLNESTKSSRPVCSDDTWGGPFCPADRRRDRRGPAGADHGQAGRRSRCGGAGRCPPPWPPGQKGLPGAPGGSQLRARDLARRDRTRPSGGFRQGGRIVVISYHSGEDRVVKDRLVNAATGGCTCPPGLPCVCGAYASGATAQPGRPQAVGEEVAANPRAESARLRAAEALTTVKYEGGNDEVTEEEPR